MWPGVGSGSSRSHHLVMVVQGFEPEEGVEAGSSQGVLLPSPISQGWGQGRAGGSVPGEIGPSLRRPSGPAYPPFLCAPLQLPSPTDKLLSLLIRLASRSMPALLSCTSCL